VTQEARAAIGALLRGFSVAVRVVGSPLYGAILEEAAADAEAGGPVWRALEGHEADPPASALPLRLTGAVHRLVLEGRAPGLARHYPSAGGDAGGEAGAPGAWTAFRSTLAENLEEVRGLVERPVQTNEVGRSAALLGGFLVVARTTGLPLRLLELGAAAGLNLRWDHYRYETGDEAFGDPSSPVRFVEPFVDARPPLGVAVRVVERAGCDGDPIDPSSKEGALTMRSYVWPDQVERHAQMAGAIEVARRVPATLERADAPVWVEERLRAPVEGLATVVFHSVFTQYLDEVGRERLRSALAEAGSRARAAAPLAWLRFEPSDLSTGMGEFRVHLTTWPGGEERLLATAAPHGPPVHWLEARA
jgi:hypothetical protein